MIFPPRILPEILKTYSWKEDNFFQYLDYLFTNWMVFSIKWYTFQVLTFQPPFKSTSYVKYNY